MNALRAAARTFIQAWAGTALGLWALSAIDPATFRGVSDLAAVGKVFAGAAIGTIPAMLALLQNWGENTTGRSFIIPRATPPGES